MQGLSIAFWKGQDVLGQKLQLAWSCCIHLSGPMHLSFFDHACFRSVVKDCEKNMFQKHVWCIPLADRVLCVEMLWGRSWSNFTTSPCGTSSRSILRARPSFFSVSALTGTRIARLEDCAGMRGDRNWQYLSTWLVPLAAHANGVCNRARHLWSRPSWYLWRSNLALIPVEDKQKKKKKKDWVWSDAAMCSASCFFTKFSSLCHVLVKQCYHYGITWEQDANGCHILFTWYLIWSNQVDEDELCMSERELYEARQKYK